MNFQQLRILREAVHQNFNLTEVANALYTSQSGVSKHIKDLEDELGVELFVRRGKRLLGLTEPGRELIGTVERMLMDAGNIKRVAEQFANSDTGSLTIATTHTQARYALPQIVRRFKAAFPRVHLVLHEANPAEIVALLQSGEADIAIATEALDQYPQLVMLPCYQWGHCVVAPDGHPILSEKSISLVSLARWPLITYDPAFAGRSRINKAFERAQLEPNIVLAAIDADVIKTYVSLGLGLGIIAKMAYDPARDIGLQAIDAGQLFGSNTTRIGLRRGTYIRQYEYDFIGLFASHLSKKAVDMAMAGPGADDEYQL